MEDQLVLNFVTSQPDTPSPARVEPASQPSSLDDKPKKSNKRSRSDIANDDISKVHKKSSSLFTSLPSLAAPKTIHAPKQDFTVNNAPLSDSFESLQLCKYLVDTLASMQITKPTFIQQQTIPKLLANSGTKGRDLILQSQTGSGKTLAYVLPILNYLLGCGMGGNRDAGTFAIVLVPTRELATQVYNTVFSLIYPKSSSSDDKKEHVAAAGDDEFVKHSAHGRKDLKIRWIVPSVLCGGQSKKSEKARIRKGVTILICTPGRLVDHLKSTKSLILTNLKYVVVDEADRFEELGMKESLAEIWTLLAKSQLPFHRILASATLSHVTSLAGVTLNDPIFVNSTPPKTKAATPAKTLPSTEPVIEVESKDADMVDAVPNQVQTFFLQVPAKVRLVTLAALIRSNTSGKMIIFFSNCATVDFHHRLLTAAKGEVIPDDCSLFRIHGSVEHSNRMKTIQDFGNCKNAVLLTTDLSARGLDLPNVSVVVQYDLPNDLRSCVHRIGRTGRCGKQGRAYLFIMPHEVKWVDRVEGFLTGEFLSYEKVLCPTTAKEEEPSKKKSKKDKKEEDPSSKLSKMELARIEASPMDGTEASGWQRHLEEIVEEGGIKAMARDALLASIRAYSTHPKDLKAVVNVKSLHIGHFAKAFGLREAPSQLINRDKNQRNNVKKQAYDGRTKVHKKKTNDSFNEFAAGAVY